MSSLPTEPVGSLPRPRALLPILKKMSVAGAGDPESEALMNKIIRETVTRFEATGSPVITDGEYGKYPNFITYPIQGQAGLAPGDFSLTFDDFNYCQLPTLTQGPFRYLYSADRHLAATRQHIRAPIKQAVISPSCLSLLYPTEPLPDYPREDFIEDLLSEHVTEIHRCLYERAYKVQIDFCDGPIALRLDPSGQLLDSYILLLHMVLDCFSTEEQKRLGIYIGTTRGDVSDSPVDVADLLARLFELPVTSFYIAAANRPNRQRLLTIIRNYIKPGQQVFIGVVDPADPRIETTAEICDVIIEASRYIPPDQLGTTDNSGFAPFADNPLTDLETAFEKICARVEGTAQAEKILNGS